MARTGNVTASRGSDRGLHARGLAALLLLAALTPAMAVAQPTPQPIFTELFAYDPGEPSQLLGRWRISSQLDSKLQSLRVGVVEDPIGKTVGRITVQEGDGLDGASQAMRQAKRYVCDSEGSRAAAMEAEPGGVVPSERAEIQVRSDRATSAGELVKFGQPVWYRFSFKIAGDWPRDVPAAGRQLCRTVIHQIKQDSFKGDGVDAPRRHLCAKVTVSNCHRRGRPWHRLLRSDWTSRSTYSRCTAPILPATCCSVNA